MSDRTVTASRSAGTSSGRPPAPESAPRAAPPARAAGTLDGYRRPVITLGLLLGAAAFLITKILPGHTSFDDIASPVSAALVLAFAALQFVPRAAKAVNVCIALQLLAYVAAKTAHILLASHDVSQFSLEAAVFVPWGPVIVIAAWVFGQSPRPYAFVAGYYAAILIPGAWLLLSRATLPPGPVLIVGANFVLASLVVTAMLRVMVNLERQQAAAEAEHRVLSEMALVDVLTALPNRRALEHDLDRETHRGNRSGRPPALIIFDIDRFKAINDRHGHEAGDRVLATVGFAVRRSLRPTDTVGRWGGDEFLAILPETGLDEAVGLAERIRRILATEAALQAGVSVTASLGVTRYRPGESIGETIARADRALYTAKSRGRNRTESTVSMDISPVKPRSQEARQPL